MCIFNNINLSKINILCNKQMRELREYKTTIRAEREREREND